jgi:hypothetical protein
VNLHEILKLCAESNLSDWHKIGCWGMRSGPSFQDRFAAVNSADGVELRHDEHGMRATYIPDVSIGLAWGMDPDNLFPDDGHSFEEEWSKQFANPQWTWHFADMLYNGTLVYRQSFVSVDSARSSLPVPGLDGVVSQVSHDLVRLIDQLEGHNEFDRYFADVGFTIRPGDGLGDF